MWEPTRGSIACTPHTASDRKERLSRLEPSEREFVRLERNIRLNGFTNILPFKVAASDREGVSSFRIAESAHSGQNTLGQFAYPIEEECITQVPLTTLDALFEKHTEKRVDIIKIDAEGAELDVLKGAEKVLTQHRPLILIEVVEAALQHQNSSREMVLGLLQSYGYQFLVFGDGGYPECDRKLIFDGVNIIAEPLA